MHTRLDIPSYEPNAVFVPPGLVSPYDGSASTTFFFSSFPFLESSCLLVFSFLPFPSLFVRFLFFSLLSFSFLPFLSVSFLFFVSFFFQLA